MSATKKSAASTPKTETKSKRKAQSIRIRVTMEEKRLWLETAERSGRNLSNWIRFLANQKAQKV